MKRSAMIRTLAIVSIFLLAVVGCSKNPAEMVDNQLEDGLKAVVEDNMDYFTTDGLNDDGAQPVSYLTGGFLKPEVLIEPIKFGRKGSFKLESLNVTKNEGGLLEAVIMYSFDGNFFIVAKDSTNSTPVDTLYKKEMKNTVTRRALFIAQDSTHPMFTDTLHEKGMKNKIRRRTPFERLGYTKNRGKKQIGHTKAHGQNWKLRGISGSELVSENCTITIDEVRIIASNGNSWTITNPMDFFTTIEEIPTFQPKDSIKVYVTLQNTNDFPEKPGSTVLLRYRNDRGMHRARKSLHDDGIAPDEVAGDGVYSGMWIIGDRRGVFHAFVDVIDNGTLYDDAAPYDSRAWGIPYKVHF